MRDRDCERFRHGGRAWDALLQQLVGAKGRAPVGAHLMRDRDCEGLRGNGRA